MTGFDRLAFGLDIAKRLAVGKQARQGVDAGAVHGERRFGSCPGTAALGHHPVDAAQGIEVLLVIGLDIAGAWPMIGLIHDQLRLSGWWSRDHLRRAQPIDGSALAAIRVRQNHVSK
jgi:hypothetical protein